MKTIQEFWIYLIVIVLAACKSSNASSAKNDNIQNSPVVENQPISSNNNINDIWVLTHIQSKPIKNSKKPVIEFHIKDKRYLGNTGCNQYGGNFELKTNNQITLSTAEMTEMFCDEDLNNIEFQLINVLPKIDQFEISGLSLILKVKGQNELQFRKID
jgi:heat shock protein HslJ